MSSVVSDENDETAPSGVWGLGFTGGPSRAPRAFHPLVDQWRDIEDKEKAAGIAPETPILVRPDGELDYRLVNYLNRGVIFKGLAPLSQDTYAQELRSWFTFLKAHDDAEWDEATVEHFVAYRTWRLFTAENEGRVTPATFGKVAPALRMFYEWAVSKGYIDSNPIPEGTRSYSGGAVPKNASESRNRWVMPRTYAMWRNVGLLDRKAVLDADRQEVLASSERIKGARGRNQARNVAFTDMLLTTALRNQELSHLLLSELPAVVTEEAILPSTLSKGGRERAWVILSPTALRGVHQYISTVRRAQVDLARSKGVYNSPDWIKVSMDGARSDRVRMDSGAARSLESFTLSERPRLLVEREQGPEPLMIWLSETGTPMDADSWGNVFIKANERVQGEYERLEIRSAPPRISAHSLRFTCALFTLLSFIQTIDERLGLDPVSPWVEANYTEAFDFVREFLGHKNETTTRNIYLKPVRDLRRAQALGSDRTLPSLIEWLAAESSLVYNPKVTK